MVNKKAQLNLNISYILFLLVHITYQQTDWNNAKAMEGRTECALHCSTLNRLAKDYIMNFCYELARLDHYEIGFWHGTAWGECWIYLIDLKLDYATFE